jgi:cobyrinic acid a,c-diamide synthase
MAHLFVAATQKSSGKTTFTTGLAAALARRGMIVQPFKKGPDYIDPMWLGRAAGRPCYNLDFHCMEEAEIIAAFCRRDREADISVIETNKGLFDGVDLQGRDSNAALASLLGAPVVLVVDTLGITRGIAPLVLGYRNFDAGVRIAGVVLNKVGGPRHEGKLRAALEYYTDMPVLGAIGRDRALEIPERHLGLVPANEADAADVMIARLADVVAGQVDLDRLIAAAGTAEGPKAAPALVPEPATVLLPGRSGGAHTGRRRARHVRRAKRQVIAPGRWPVHRRWLPGDTDGGAGDQPDHAREHPCGDRSRHALLC